MKLIMVSLVLNCVFVIGLATALRHFFTLALRHRLGLSHTIWSLIGIAVCPLWIAMIDDPANIDAYLPFLLNPIGLLIYVNSTEWGAGVAQDVLLICCVRIVLPGTIGLLAGLLGWYYLGACVDKYRLGS